MSARGVFKLFLLNALLLILAAPAVILAKLLKMQ